MIPHNTPARARLAPIPVRVKGSYGRQADGTAGLPPASEIAGAFRHLRFVPTCDIRPPKSFTEHAIEKLPNPTMDDQKRRGDGMAQHRTSLGDAWVDKSAAIPNHGSFGLLNTDD